MFCSKSDIELAERLCNAYPVICDLDRDRAQVDLSLDQDNSVVSVSVELPDS